mmetsp:Transcript_18712/g.71167  ORF Transcript_18712/g.71167 Transcript_18712/m.71167 type:complete len:212 (-) Transcript_18712:471-1106(-)
MFTRYSVPWARTAPGRRLTARVAPEATTAARSNRSTRWRKVHVERPALRSRTSRVPPAGTTSSEKRMVTRGRARAEAAPVERRAGASASATGGLTSVVRKGQVAALSCARFALPAASTTNPAPSLTLYAVRSSRVAVRGSEMFTQVRRDGSSSSAPGAAGITVTLIAAAAAEKVSSPRTVFTTRTRPQEAAPSSAPSARRTGSDHSIASHG